MLGSSIDRRMALAGLGSLLVAPGAARAASGPIAMSLIVEDNRLWVGATINGSTPLLFIIDTGASGNFIRPEIAKRLNLTALRSGRVGGVGGKSSTTLLVEGRNVVVGGATRQPRMEFSTYDFGRGLPADAAGLFAAGLFTAHDSDIDFDSGRWQIWPDGRSKPAGGRLLDGASISASSSRAPSERITVTAMLDGRPYRLNVDTGAPNALLLLPRASRRSGLFEKKPHAIRPTRGFGGAAARYSRVVRASRFELGPLVVDGPVVTAMDPSQAISLGVDGVLGLPLISMLNLSTTLTPDRINVARNKRALRPDSYPRSGLWLEPTPAGGAVVGAVGGGSPGEAAGIRAGDALVEPQTFGAAIARINAPSGTAVTLRLRREGAEADYQVTPSDYL